MFLTHVGSHTRLPFCLRRHVVHVIYAQVVALQPGKCEAAISSPLGGSYIRPTFMLMRKVGEQFPHSRLISKIGLSVVVFSILMRHSGYKLILLARVAFLGIGVSWHGNGFTYHICQRNSSDTQTSAKVLFNHFNCLGPLRALISGGSMSSWFSSHSLWS